MTKEITVNDQSMQFAGRTLGDLLDKLNLNRPYVAVSVNNTIVPKSERTQFELKSADAVVIVQAVGGG